MSRRRKRSPVPILISLVLVVLIVLVARLYFQSNAGNENVMDKTEYYGLTSEEEAPLMVNDTLLDVRGLVRDGKIYIDYDTVQEQFNSSFYWETASNELLLMLPDGLHTAAPDDGSGNVYVDGDTIYIEASYIQENSDIDMTILSDPMRVVARTVWKNIAAEEMTEDAAVRTRSDKKGQVITYVKSGDIVVLLENTENWCKVATADGVIGYVQKDSLKEAAADALSHTTDEKFIFPKILRDYKINLAWMYVQSYEGNDQLDILTENAVGLNVISPTWFVFASDAGDLTSYAEKDYVDSAHAKGLEVWGAIQDVYGDGFDAGEIFATADARAHVIEQLIDVCDKTGMDGINVDIETISENTAPQFLQFLRELSYAAHAKNIVVSTDNYVPGYTDYYERGEQAKTVDYIIIMGYDEHTTSSEEAGSVASLSYVEEGIQKTLEEVPAEQVINAIPFYTRGWTEQFGQEGLISEAFGMNGADQWATDHGITLTWDASVGQYQGSVEVDNARYSIWLEEEKSIEEKMKLIQKYELAGVAEWRLGFERSTVWEVINQYLN